MRFDRRPRPPHRFLVSDAFPRGELRVRGQILAHIFLAGFEPIAKDELKHGFRRASRFAGEAFQTSLLRGSQCELSHDSSNRAEGHIIIAGPASDCARGNPPRACGASTPFDKGVCDAPSVKGVARSAGGSQRPPPCKLSGNRSKCKDTSPPHPPQTSPPRPERQS